MTGPNRTTTAPHAAVRPRTLLAAGFLLFALGYVVMAWNLGEEARRAPLVFGVPTLALAAINFVREFGNDAGPEDEATPARAPAAPPASTADAEDGEGTGARRPVAPGRAGGRPLRAYAWLLGFTGLYVVFGQTLGFLLGSAAFLRFEGARSWLGSVVYSVALTASVWLAFGELLGVRRYFGLLDLPF